MYSSAKCGRICEYSYVKGVFLLCAGLRSDVLDQLISHRISAYRVSTDRVIMNMQLENISQIFVLLKRPVKVLSILHWVFI